MQLISARVKNSRSVEDSGDFEIGDLNCLVGKNEAGKTAILRALYGLRPVEEMYAYDKTQDYPRRYLTDFLNAIQMGGQKWSLHAGNLIMKIKKLFLKHLDLIRLQ